MKNSYLYLIRACQQYLLTALFISVLPSLWGQSQTYYLLDFQSDNGTADGFTFVPTDANFHASKGYGWKKSKSDERATFRLKAPKGAYFLTLKLNSTGKDTLSPKLSINGQPIQIETTTPWRRISHRTLRIPVNTSKPYIKITFEGKFSLDELELWPQTPYTDLNLPPGLESDTAAIRQAIHLLSDQLASNPASIALQHQLHLLKKYQLATYYYEIGWWSWAVEETGMSIFPRYDVASDLLRQVLVDPQDPMHDRAVYLLGKIHYWLYREQEFPHDIIEYRTYFDLIKDRYPNHERLRMYMGESVPYPSDCQQIDPNAPKWANLQRELMCRMHEIIQFWTGKQAENGELGGKFGDDVEILRWWLPAILGADDSLARLGYTRLADGVWESGKLYRGYSKRVNDVEHAAEFFRDSHTAMMLIQYGEPRFVERCLISMQNFRDVWTGKTKSGNLHLKSSYFSATEMSEGPPFGVDVPMNARATLPMLWTGWYNHNPSIIDLFSQWGHAWVNAAERTDKGKPKGLLPAAVAFDTDEIGGYSDNWYHPNLGWKYYKWEAIGGVEEMHNQLLGMYDLTGDARFLEPTKQTLALAMDTRNQPSDEPGTAGWAGAYLRGEKGKRAIEMAGLAREISGEEWATPFLKEYGTTYNQFQLTQQTAQLEEGLAKALEDLRYNLPIRTDEAKFTDRVNVSGEEILMGMYTGHPGTGLEFPALDVSWENTGANMGILVREGDREKVRVDVFNFGDQKWVNMRCWNLKPGRYSYEVTDKKSNETLAKSEFQLEGRGHRVPLRIPSKREVEIYVELLTADPAVPFQLPDLAISAEEVKFLGDSPKDETKQLVELTVHNIGNETAKGIEIYCWNGKVLLTTEKIAELAAPNDLNPRFVKVQLALPKDESINDYLVKVICEQKEITKENNQLKFPIE